MIPACPAPREPSQLQAPLPPKTCDTHAHGFGPAARFPYAADRSYTPPDAPLASAGFQSLLRLLGAGGCWVKPSGAHRIGRNAPDYPDAQAFHQALVSENPDRLVWEAIGRTRAWTTRCRMSAISSTCSTGGRPMQGSAIAFWSPIRRGSTGS